MFHCDREPDQTDVRVGARIAQRRHELGISQIALARAIGMALRHLAAYEAGSLRPRPSELFEIAGSLDAPIAYFFDAAVAAARPSGRQLLP